MQYHLSHTLNSGYMEKWEGGGEGSDSYLTKYFPKSDWVLNKKWPIHFELMCNYFEYSIKMGTHDLCWVQLLKNKIMYFLAKLFLYISISLHMDLIQQISI